MLLYCIVACRFPGDPPNNKPGDGFEDEQVGHKQAQHVERGPAHEPTVTQKHPQVRSSCIAVSRQATCCHHAMC